MFLNANSRIIKKSLFNAFSSMQLQSAQPMCPSCEPQYFSDTLQELQSSAQSMNEPVRSCQTPAETAGYTATPGDSVINPHVLLDTRIIQGKNYVHTVPEMCASVVQKKKTQSHPMLVWLHAGTCGQLASPASITEKAVSSRRFFKL